MLRGLAIAIACLTASTAGAFDLQGHRGARGLEPENTLAAFAKALSIGVTTLELDVAVTKDDVLVVSHDRRLNPDHTRGPDGHFLDTEGPPIRSLTLAELQRYDVGRLKPGTRYAALFPDQEPHDGAHIPTLAQVFELVQRSGADQIRFNIETKLTPTSGAETPEPEAFAQALATAVRNAGLTARVTVQSFDWRTLVAMQRIAPEIERSCLTAQAPNFDTLAPAKPGPSPWTAGFDIDAVGGSAPRLVAAAGCAVWSPLSRDVTADRVAEAKALKLKIVPWTVNELIEMERLIALGVDGLITDYPDRLRAMLGSKEIPLPPAVPAQ